MPLPPISSIPSTSFTTNLHQDEATQFDIFNKLLMNLEQIKSPTLGDHTYALALHKKTKTLANNEKRQWKRPYQELALKFLLRGAILNPKNEHQFETAKDIFNVVRESNPDHAFIQQEHVDGYVEACTHNYARHLVYTGPVQQIDAFEAYEIYKDIENKDKRFWRGLQYLYFAYRQLAQANKQSNSLEHLRALKARFHHLETEYKFSIPPAVFSNIDHLYSEERYLMQYDTNPKNIPN